MVYWTDIVCFRKTNTAATVAAVAPVATIPVPVVTPTPAPAETSTSERSDLTYDPNEPRYCICNEVAFGGMVACDNKTVSGTRISYPVHTALTILQIIQYFDCLSFFLWPSLSFSLSFGFRFLFSQYTCVFVWIAPSHTLTCKGGLKSFRPSMEGGQIDQ